MQDERDPRSVDALCLSGGEIHFLRWFIQGSIMNPDTRRSLRRAWGLCERHVWSAMAVEAVFRHDFLHSLIRALDHPEPTTPVRAATILGELREPRAVERLVAILRTRADGFLRAAVATARGRIGNCSAVPALAETLRVGPLVARLARRRGARRTGWRDRRGGAASGSGE